ncbi:threonine aldolase family protein [Aquimarina sp. 2-A2]|uniref:threonine aldolase family protein n=1 Tax=Aquimarina sp. 2-A2 TaxID=3382644 RepID=UPI00387EEF49
MKKLVENNQRRDFLKKCGLSTLPFFLPTISLSNTSPSTPQNNNKSPVNFVYDGLAFSPQEYLEKLNEINKTHPIEPDFYGNGGATKALEDTFAKLTGKEKAIYLPTGTMANQLAIKLLSEDNTKVLVPENSHIYRDEADAAQSVHGKRLVPIGKGKAYFDLSDLKETLSYLNENEVFKSGIGTVAIENPIRRADGTTVPIETIKELSTYCKENGYKLHLDGARIHLAATYTKVSLTEYASYFDTVYISLYKYLNATGGAILCGDAALIDKIAHQIKIHGGTVFQNWNNTAVASHYLDGIDQRWKKVVSTANVLISELNKLEGITITKIKNGTNIYDLKLAARINLKKLAVFLNKEHTIWLGRANQKGIIKFTVNESILTRDIKEIISAWKEGVDMARQ